MRQWNCKALRSRSGDGASVHGMRNGITFGSWIPCAARRARATRSSSSGGRSSIRGVRIVSSKSGHSDSDITRVCRRRSTGRARFALSAGQGRGRRRWPSPDLRHDTLGAIGSELCMRTIAERDVEDGVGGVRRMPAAPAARGATADGEFPSILANTPPRMTTDSLRISSTASRASPRSRAVPGHASDMSSSAARATRQQRSCMRPVRHQLGRERGTRERAGFGVVPEDELHDGAVCDHRRVERRVTAGHQFVRRRSARWPAPDG